MAPSFVIRLDDAAPGMPWDAARRLERIFAASGVRPLVGVVPDNLDPELDRGPRRRDFWDAARRWAAAGWTVAQHGHQHLCASADGGLLRVQPRGEFAGLPYAEQERKLRLGRDVLAREGLASRVFMAPAHAFDAATLRALAALGFEAVTDGYGLFPYEQGGLTLVPQLFSRPYHVGVGVYTVCLHPALMAEADMRALEAFCRERRAWIVSFPEAAARRGPRGLDAATRALIAGGVRAARALRRAARGGAWDAFHIL